MFIGIDLVTSGVKPLKHWLADVEADDFVHLSGAGQECISPVWVVPELFQTHLPCDKSHKAYMQKRKKFQKLYAQLKDIF